MKKSLLFLVVSALLWGGAATVQAEIYSGECGADGANVTWKLDTETGLLEISGTGAMENYYGYYSSSPWLNYCTSITSLTIGDGVTSIGDYAFSDCSGLTSVTIPESVQTIGDGAFSGCSGLTEFKGKFASDNGHCLIVNDTLKAFAPSGLAQYIIPDEVKVIGGRAFEFCTCLTSVTIREGVTSIGEDAFCDCESLTSVMIENGVQTIGDDAFYNCTGLTLVTIPESVQVIGERAFYGCDGLTEFKGKFAVDNCCLIVNDTLKVFAHNCGLSEYTIPDEVKVIGERAFSGCPSLTSVTIPESVTAIDNDAFSWCDGLTSITIGEGVTSIGERAFSLCESLESVTIPNSVTVIGKDAFACCESLMSVTIGESVTSIGNGAFGACKSLEKFEGKWASEDNRCLIVNDTLRFFAQGGLPSYSIPNGVTAIGNDAFVRCTALESVTIPPSVTSIGNDAFDWCEALESVTIGEGVTSIGKSAFFSCESLKSVTACNPTPVNIVITDEWEEVYFAFEYVNCAKCTLYVPAESVEKYKAAEGWKEFGTILPIGASAITETQQEQADGHITVYNLQGVPVLETDDAAALRKLSAGAYIVNGKKMIIAR